MTSPPPPKRPGGILSLFGCSTTLAAAAGLGAVLLAAVLSGSPSSGARP